MIRHASKGLSGVTHTVSAGSRYKAKHSILSLFPTTVSSLISHRQTHILQSTRHDTHRARNVSPCHLEGQVSPFVVPSPKRTDELTLRRRRRGTTGQSPSPVTTSRCARAAQADTTGAHLKTSSTMSARRLRTSAISRTPTSSSSTQTIPQQSSTRRTTS